ncbi:uncharacterized protein A4U43_C05F9270 [Asparagus officinalis]|uniref:Uncharacterized protein n=1 Tax=Asparagus officinalis TaxID=4686 RepID=A0A5P1EQG9_ASPOF|nr:uncharacterized protein A4U43_C05F9270 [Asparagus officinalis]
MRPLDEVNRGHTRASSEEAPQDSPRQNPRPHRQPPSIDGPDRRRRQPPLATLFRRHRNKGLLRLESLRPPRHQVRRDASTSVAPIIGQVHQVAASLTPDHPIASTSSRLREAQGLAEAGVGDVLPVRELGAEGGAGEDHGEHQGRGWGRGL